MHKRQIYFNSRVAQPKHFLYLHILDRQINQLLSGLRSIFNPDQIQPCNMPISLLVGGPYQRAVLLEHFDQLQEALESHPLIISDAAIWSERGVCTSYLSASSAALHESSHYRPNFPIGDIWFGRHIEIYIGPNRQLAEQVCELLNNPPLTLSCCHTQLTRFATRSTHELAEQADRTDDQETSKELATVSKRLIKKAKALMKAQQPEGG